MYNLLDRVEKLSAIYICSKENELGGSLHNKEVLHTELIFDEHNFIFGRLEVVMLETGIVNIELRVKGKSLVLKSGLPNKGVYSEGCR